MARKSQPPPPQEPPRLVISKAQALENIQNRIEKAKVVFKKQITHEGDLDELRLEKKKWDSVNEELLRNIFSNDSIAKEYSHVHGPMHISRGFDYQEVSDFNDGVLEKINFLEALKERLDWMEMSAESTHVNQAFPELPRSFEDVFVVHGHDESAKLAATAFLKKIGLNPIVLHEKANEGRTIVEKFEDHSNVAFAVVLLTPDDVGYPKGEEKKLKARARQNVILEAGFFHGKLGRKKLCVLYKAGVELPSDYDGILYVEMDSHEGWKNKLATELKAAGLKIDPSGLLG